MIQIQVILMIWFFRILVILMNLLLVTAAEAGPRDKLGKPAAEVRPFNRGELNTRYHGARGVTKPWRQVDRQGTNNLLHNRKSYGYGFLQMNYRNNSQVLTEFFRNQGLVNDLTREIQEVDRRIAQARFYFQQDADFTRDPYLSRRETFARDEQRTPQAPKFDDIRIMNFLHGMSYMEVADFVKKLNEIKYFLISEGNEQEYQKLFMTLMSDLTYHGEETGDFRKANETVRILFNKKLWSLATVKRCSLSAAWSYWTELIVANVSSTEPNEKENSYLANMCIYHLDICHEICELEIGRELAYCHEDSFLRVAHHFCKILHKLIKEKTVFRNLIKYTDSEIKYYSTLKKIPKSTRVSKNKLAGEIFDKDYRRLLGDQPRGYEPQETRCYQSRMLETGNYKYCPYWVFDDYGNPYLNY